MKLLTKPKVYLVSKPSVDWDQVAAFLADEDVPGGIRIGLVDDVVTTGATLASCCKALEKRVNASVWGVALASPYPRSSEQTFPGKL